MYYPSNCDSLPAHSADPCEEIEYGRIRSAGFIYLDYAFDPASAAAWQSGVTAGKIFIIPETNGDAPKGAPITGLPYGRRPEVLLGYNFTAHYSDPNFQSNCAFYNAAVGNMNYRFFYRTSSQVYITDQPVSITPNRDIKNDLTSGIVWEVEVKWIDKHFPCGIAIPDGAFDPPLPAAPYYYPTDDHTHDGGGAPTG